MKKTLLFAFALLVLGFQLYAQNNQPGGSPVHRIIMHLSTDDTIAWKGMMKNIKNLKAGWGDKVMIEVVANGPGIEFLMKGKTTQQESIAYFKSQGVEFMGCENTLIDRNIPKSMIIPEAGFVKMGVGEIIMKQEQGWAYIKAGF